jgi:hypothetical protein
MRYLGSLDERHAAVHREVEGECPGYASRDKKPPERCHCSAASGSSQGAAALPGVSDRQDPATQWEIAQHIFDELDVHAQLEEVVFYQAVEEETTSLGKRLVHASLEEHQEALALIQDLRSLAPGCPEFDTTFQALVLTVEHHMTEEETEMFPLAEAEVGEDLQDLRDEMLHLKARLLAS